MASKAQLERQYGITIVKSDLDNEYTIYSADGCKWENGLRTIRAVETECRWWHEELLQIKENAYASREKKETCSCNGNVN